uniref:Uncharacterized protein n=1 Tax=Panagrolaimus superbus TaxID=310955 RepID=A0A914YLU4_9BILA
MSNQVPNRRRERSSNPSSTSDDNENCEPLSENSEKNLQMLASMGYPASHFPSPIICNTRKRKAASNIK